WTFHSHPTSWPSVATSALAVKMRWPAGSASGLTGSRKARALAPEKASSMKNVTVSNVLIWWSEGIQVGGAAVSDISATIAPVAVPNTIYVGTTDIHGLNSKSRGITTRAVDERTSRTLVSSSPHPNGWDGEYCPAMLQTVPHFKRYRSITAPLSTAITVVGPTMTTMTLA